MRNTLLIGSLLVLLLACTAMAQSTATGTTNLTVNVVPEAWLQVDASTALTNSGHFDPFIGTTNFTYKIRTGTAGSGTLQVQVAEFSPTGGPTVAGGNLTYTCTLPSPGTACATAQTASTSTPTSVGTFGAAAHSAKAGSTGSVSWSLLDDPTYAIGNNYKAVVTWTLSAT